MHGPRVVIEDSRAHDISAETEERIGAHGATAEVGLVAENGVSGLSHRSARLQCLEPEQIPGAVLAGLAVGALLVVVESWARTEPQAIKPPTASAAINSVFVDFINITLLLFLCLLLRKTTWLITISDVFDKEKLQMTQYFGRRSDCGVYVLCGMGCRNKPRLELGRGKINSSFEHAMEKFRKTRAITFKGIC